MTPILQRKILRPGLRYLSGPTPEGGGLTQPCLSTRLSFLSLSLCLLRHLLCTSRWGPPHSALFSTCLDATLCSSASYLLERTMGSPLRSTSKLCCGCLNSTNRGGWRGRAGHPAPRAVSMSPRAPRRLRSLEWCAQRGKTTPAAPGPQRAAPGAERSPILENL